jgi:hypothetical protein
MQWGVPYSTREPLVLIKTIERPLVSYEAGELFKAAFACMWNDLMDWWHRWQA